MPSVECLYFASLTLTAQAYQLTNLECPYLMALSRGCLPLLTSFLYLFSLHPSHFVFTDQTAKISAILNQDAFLPCETRRSINLHVSPPRKRDDHINLILWYRDGSSLPFYSIDARTLEDLDPDDMLAFASKGKHSKNDTRIEFDFRESAPLLRIRNVTEEDEGLYQCRVEYTSQRTFITAIRLNVIGAPAALEITDSSGNPLEGVIGPFNEFESITLVCTAYGGRPKPSVIWFKQRGYYEEIIDDSYEYLSLESPIKGALSTVANVLHLRHLDRNDYLARYLCRAATRFYYPPLLQSITIDMNLLPVNVRIYSSQYHTSPQSSPLIAGVVAEFGCKTDGSKPAASIEWFLDHQRIVIPNADRTYTSSHHYATDEEDFPATAASESQTHLVVGDERLLPQQAQSNWSSISALPFSASSASSASLGESQFLSIIGSAKANSTLSVIRFLPQSADNGRILSCHAWNPFIANSKIADKLALDVKYAPQLTIGLGTKEDILRQEHFASSSSSAAASDSTVDSGVSTSANLSTAATAAAKPEEKARLLVAESSAVLELNCHIKANPWIDQVIWHVNGTAITAMASPSSRTSPSEPFYSSSVVWSKFSAQFEAHMKRTTGASPPNTPALYLTNHNQTLRLENVVRYHAGQYYCSARNLINTTSSQIVQLDVAYKPQCTSNRTAFIDVRRNVPLQLACNVEANPSAGLTFHWSLFSPWTSKEIDFKQSELEHTAVVNGHSVSVLDVDRAVAFFESEQHRKKVVESQHDDEQPSSSSSAADEPHSTLLLQCDAVNVAGRQEAPCAFLLRIVDGPPEKVSNCTFTVEQAREGGSNLEATWPTEPEDGDMVTNANKQQDQEHQQPQPQPQPRESTVGESVLVRCLAGSDGGKVQTFHLIGLLAGGSPTQPDGTKLFQSSVSESPLSGQQPESGGVLSGQYWPSARNVSSIMELIQSMQSSGSMPVTVATDSTTAAEQSTGSLAASLLRPPLFSSSFLQWNVSTNEVAQFRLPNVTLGQHYDLIIWADNLIGHSVPLLYRSLLLLNDSSAGNPANVAPTSPSRPNWVYLRFKGFVLVFLLLLIMALIGLAIRRYLATASLYERSTQSLDDDVSTELNEAETMLQPKQSADNCEPASVTGGRQEPKGQSPIEDQEIEEATTETAENGLVSVSSSTDSSPSSCAPENGSSITRPAPVQVGSLTRPLGRHLSAVKRFLNRFILISTSHYRSYELTPCEVLPPGAMAATQPETETALATSPTLEPSLDVIHSNSEQECINWEAYRSSRQRLSTGRMSQLLDWLSRTRIAPNGTLPSGADLAVVGSSTNDTMGSNGLAADPVPSKNVELLYVFTRKL